MLNNNIFINRSIEIHENKYDYSLVIYKNSKTKVKIICPIHGIFEQTPNKHLYGQKCPYCSEKKMNKDIFIKKSNIIHNNKYDYSLVIYKNNRTKVKIICPIHGIFEQTPSNHMNLEQGCTKCSKNIMTINNFIEKSNVIHKNKYDYSLVIYKNSKTKVKIICPVHGIFEQFPYAHINKKQGCMDCYKNNMFDNSDIFIKKSKEVHGYKYDYSLVEYKNSKTKVKIICSEHGIFEQIPNDHLMGSSCKLCNKNIVDETEFYLKVDNIHKNKYNYSKLIFKNLNNYGIIICPIHGEFKQLLRYHYNGSGCPKCSGKNITTEDFIKKSKEVHCGKYDYSLVNYKNNKEKIKIICLIHGKFDQSPNHHLSGKGCPKCKSSKGELNIENLLKSLDIKYETQKIFNDCKYILPLKFDFYLQEYNICIEYDGEQHFKKYKFEKTNEKLEIRKKRDDIKNTYCKENNINLIRVKFDENIENKLNFLNNI